VSGRRWIDGMCLNCAPRLQRLLSRLARTAYRRKASWAASLEVAGPDGRGRAGRPELGFGGRQVGEDCSDARTVAWSTQSPDERAIADRDDEGRFRVVRPAVVIDSERPQTWWLAVSAGTCQQSFYARAQGRCPRRTVADVHESVVDRTVSSVQRVGPIGLTGAQSRLYGMPLRKARSGVSRARAR